jgi:capsular exopolysaccharide synthesis family protein
MHERPFSSRSNPQIVHVAYDEPERTSLEPMFATALRVLRRRKLLACLVFLLFSVPAAIFVKSRTPVYQSTARMLVEPRDEIASVMRDPSDNRPPVDNSLQTHLQLLRSRPVVVRTIQAMKLWQAPQFAAPAALDLSDDAVASSGLVDAFLAHLAIVQTPNTPIVNITFEAADPDLTANAVNTLTATYLDQQAAEAGHDASSVRQWVDQRLAEQRERLTASEAALHAYLAQHDAVAVTDGDNITVQKLSDLNTALTRAKTERMSKEALYRQLASVRSNPDALGTLPVVMSNAVLQQLRAQLAELKQKEAALSQELGDRHPDMLALRAEIELTSGRLDAEVAKLTEAVRNELEAAQAIERDLTGALESQKREVVGLNQKSLDYGALQRQVNSDRQIYQRLLTESQTRAVTDTVTPGRLRIVEAAVRPLRPIGPQTRRDLLLVVLAGIVLGLAAPLAAEALDHRVKTPADVEERLNVSCLALVPLVRRPPRGGRPLMTLEGTAYNEAFRRIRAALRPVRPGARAASRLLVTSALPAEGKSLVAVNLAIAFARAGQRVLLVDADLRRPVVHRNFGMEPSPGLSNLLTREVNPKAAIRATPIHDLFVLTSGAEHADAAELLASPNLPLLLGLFDDRFDWIVLDSPPVGPVADACLIAPLVHQTLVVVAASSTTVAAGSTAIDQLKASGARIAGAVLNRADMERSAYYYSPYYHSTNAVYYGEVVGTRRDARRLEPTEEGAGSA